MNTYQHPDADALVTNVGKIIKPLTDLVRRARDSDDVDLVYVNDNFGDFTAQFSDIVHSACHGERPDLVEPRVRITAAWSPRFATARSIRRGWRICSIVLAPSG